MDLVTKVCHRRDIIESGKICRKKRMENKALKECSK